MRSVHTSGFALPTVMIASVVMLMVLLSGLTASSSVNASLKQQYDDKIIKQAEESGRTMALACMMARKATWTDASPLRPNTTCAGGAACTNAPTCYVLYGASLRTSFSVSTPIVVTDGTYSFKVNVTLDKVRVSSGQVLATQTATGNGSAAAGWKQMSPGNYHTCGISLSNKAYCWGASTSDELGRGVETGFQVLEPVPVSQSSFPAGIKIKQIAAGKDFSCALTTNSRVYCWGSNEYGRTGNGSTTGYTPYPTEIAAGVMPANTVLTSVTAGFGHACALSDLGNLYCWGYNFRGQLGNDTVADASTPTAVILTDVSTNKFKSVEVGSLGTCGISSNNLAYCWGLGWLIGNAVNAQRNRPTAVAQGQIPAGVTHKELSVGDDHVCSIGSNNAVYCWGSNTYGQLATGNTNMPLTPTSVTGILDGPAVQIKAGTYTTCSLTGLSRLYCWGDNNYGKVGNNTAIAQYTTPVEITNSGGLSGKKTINVYGESNTFCATDNVYRAYCWGLNSRGQYGDNTQAGVRFPVANIRVHDSTLHY